MNEDCFHLTVFFFELVRIIWNSKL